MIHLKPFIGNIQFMREPNLISLRPNDIRSFRGLEKQVTPMELSRFKSLTEGSCIPLHINQDYDVKFVSVFLEPKARLKHVDDIHMKALAIAKKEEWKLMESGASGRWIDGERLSVKSISSGKKSITFMNNILLQSEILAMKGLPFERVARAGGFRLDTQAHILAMDSGNPVILVGRQKKGPGQPTMESKALLTPLREEALWTIATSRALDTDVLRQPTLPEQAWLRNILKQFDGEVGLQSESAGDSVGNGFYWDLKYIGTTIDLHMSVGVTGILGLIDTNLSPQSIDDARADASLVLEAVPLEMYSLGKFLQVNRDNMVPQFITGLLMLGYDFWGEEFLIHADR